MCKTFLVYLQNVLAYLEHHFHNLFQCFPTAFFIIFFNILILQPKMYYKRFYRCPLTFKYTHKLYLILIRHKLPAIEPRRHWTSYLLFVVVQLFLKSFPRRPLSTVSCSYEVDMKLLDDSLLLPWRLQLALRFLEYISTIVFV